MVLYLRLQEAKQFCAPFVWFCQPLELYTFICIKYPQQRLFLKATVLIALSFVVGRIMGLVLDGYDQHFTYYELAFEVSFFFCSITCLY